MESVSLLRRVLFVAFIVATPLASGFSNHPVGAFSTSTSTSLFAEAPKYSKHEGFLQQAECVGEGSYLLTIDYPENRNDDETEYPNYEPGHVLALEIQPPSTEGESEESSSKSTPSSVMTTMTEKTQKDLDGNGGWLRGPYTVSFGYGADNNDGFKVLVKEVGYKSHVFATSKPGTPVLFGGKFKVPIAEGIVAASAAVAESDGDSDIEPRGETNKVVLISSGVGVGPCVGGIEELLRSKETATTIRSIDLIASFRTREQISMEAAVEKFNSSKDDDNDDAPTVQWKPVITSEGGRLSANGPESLRDHYLRDDYSSVQNTHYHIIGNGQLVTEWKEGLAKAGVPSSRVTVEAYFNHAGAPDATAVDTICEAVRGADTSTTTTTEKSREAVEVSP